MNRKIFREKALCLITLFLLTAFSGAVNAQETTTKTSAKFSTDFLSEANEAGSLNLKIAVSENRSMLFGKNTKSPQTNAPPPNNRQNVYVFPTRKERFRKYINRIFGPAALGADVASATISQITDTPEEWENNFRGFGKRLASTFGRKVITQTVIYGLDEAFTLDSSYYKSTQKNFKARLKNAVLSTFTARKPSGKRVFGFPRVIGVYTSAITANEVWFPPNRSYKDGLRSGTISLGTSVGINFLREFF